jgi:phage terminase large subunit-like protein
MVKSFAAQLVEALENSWRAVARPNQLPPLGDWWQIWLLLAGRGFGKTRTLAEWICEQVLLGLASRIALVAATAADARDVLVEGGERHSCRRSVMVPAGLRALETAADLAQRCHRDNI